MQRHLIIFVKAPRYGAVKTRLARDIGRFEAWRFYRTQSQSVCRRLGQDRRWRTWLAVTPDGYARHGRFWPNHLPRIAQGSGDLGVRMHRAMARFMPGRVVLIGSDIPDISVQHIATAFDALGKHHAVFGPAPDGGYWLIGLRRRAHRLAPFGHVAWSTSKALAQTRANLPRSYRAAELATLQDIDDGAGWRVWRKRQ